MSNTFDLTLPTPRDRARHAVADIGPDEWLRQNEEYDSVLALYDDWRIGAAVMAESLAVQYAQQPDSFSASGDMSVSWKDRVTSWFQIARQLRSEVAAESTTTSAYSLVSAAPERDVLTLSEYSRR